MSNFFPKEIEDIDELKKVSLKELFGNNKFSRGVIMAAGGYNGQDFNSIIQTKIYDIKQNGFCFWAFRGITSDSSLKKAFEFLDVQGEKYIIMTFTLDPQYAQGTNVSIEKSEKIEDYFKRMKKIKIEHPEKKHAEKFKYITSDSFEIYPDNLFPEILLDTAKNNSLAYLISDFYFAKDNIEIDTLCSMFKQYEVTKNKQSKCNYHRTQGKHRIISLENVDTNKFKNESDGIRFIIAKLKYPYLAKVISN